jgi:glutamyl-Q tRNA(Asp) synthetase
MTNVANVKSIALMPTIGRFAPSPTGPLHFGSLVAALGSYLNVKSQRGAWLLRIEDIDPPREQPGACQAITELLSAYQLLPDQAVQFQSQQSARHWQMLQQLIDCERAFACHCSRSELGGGVHLGRCSAKANSAGRPPSYRFDISQAPEHIEFVDQIQGETYENLWQSAGDFVLWRSDGLPSYQHACVVDDSDSGVTEVVRGLDLLDSTARQIVLQRALKLPTPRYAHLPLVLGADGQKLSKQNLAPALDSNAGPTQLKAALQALGQAIPRPRDEREILAEAIENWELQHVPRAERPRKLI